MAETAEMVEMAEILTNGGLRVRIRKGPIARQNGSSKKKESPNKITEMQTAR